jgi:hypothetical protein
MIAPEDGCSSIVYNYASVFDAKEAEHSQCSRYRVIPT